MGPVATGASGIGAGIGGGVGIMGPPIGGPAIIGGGGGGAAKPTPGTASPRTATGPYLAMTSPKLPYDISQKNAGSNRKTVG